MPSYSYPPMENRRLIGKRLTRLDGVQKAAGKAKYNSDVRPAGTIHAVGVFSAHAHAKIKSIDTSAAEKAPGFAGVSIVNPFVIDDVAPGEIIVRPFAPAVEFRTLLLTPPAHPPSRLAESFLAILKRGRDDWTKRHAHARNSTRKPAT